jgi:hypothetical protein
MPPNWIDDVMSEVEHVETPRSWIYWSLLCAVSAAMGNNYDMKILRGSVQIKANLYVVLLGESGLGKEFPISLSRELMEKADVTRVIAGRSSIQAVIKELSTARTRPGGKPPFTDSRGFIVNGELSTAIIQDPDSLTVLTDLYDRKSSWTNLLKGDGAEKLKEPYITALFGSSPAHFHESIPQVNMEGGYVGRNLIIEESKRFKETDFFDGDDNPTQGFDYEKFSKHLIKIAENGGKIVSDMEAKNYFNEWRRDWRSKGLTDKTGFVNRVPVHVLKVSMCLCVADYDTDLVVRPRHIEEAIERVVPLAYTSKKASEGKGLDALAAPTKKVLDYLISAPGNTLRRRQLLTKGYGDFDTATLEKILDNLEEIKWIERVRIVAGANSDWEISLSGEPLKQYKEFMNRRKAQVK